MENIEDGKYKTKKIFVDCPEKRVEVVYQPQISCETGKIVGWEALSRFPDAIGNGMNIQSIIRQMEEEKTIHRVDYYILEQVYHQLAREIALGKKVVSVSVNFSQHTLLRNDLIHYINALRHKFDIPENLIKFEVTETAEGVHPSLLTERLSALKKMGIMCSLDDFGSRGVALSSLSSNLFDEVKIDKSLTDTLTTNPMTHKLFQMIGQFCKDAQLYTVVEGVETRAQYNAICEMGFDAIQGYYISAPVSAAIYRQVSMNYSLFSETSRGFNYGKTNVL